jgi:hypothetical protein
LAIATAVIAAIVVFEVGLLLGGRFLGVPAGCAGPRETPAPAADAGSGPDLAAPPLVIEDEATTARTSATAATAAQRSSTTEATAAPTAATPVAAESRAAAPADAPDRPAGATSAPVAPAASPSRSDEARPADGGDGASRRAVAERQKDKPKPERPAAKKNGQRGRR